MRGDPFKADRFRKSIILMAVRWYCRIPPSNRDVRDFLAERGLEVDATTVDRWAQQLGTRSPGAFSCIAAGAG